MEGKGYYYETVHCGIGSRPLSDALQLDNRTLRGEADNLMRSRLDGWSRYLRVCTPFHKLLRDLEPILEGYQSDYKDEYHNIVQWLKETFLDVSSTSTRTDYPCGRVFEEGTSESAFFFTLRKRGENDYDIEQQCGKGWADGWMIQPISYALGNNYALRLELEASHATSHVMEEQARIICMKKERDSQLVQSRVHRDALQCIHGRQIRLLCPEWPLRRM
ncbi:hypothetical protein B0H13DRAFT_1880250 [Mycena leptocephala]|nr:hypothetical protein B0H13DRAFT_1880250 [Mycena leptocephala]